MTKAQSRMLRQIKGHCKYSSQGWLGIIDKRRWKTAIALYELGLIELLPSDNFCLKVSSK